MNKYDFNIFRKQARRAKAYLRLAKHQSNSIKHLVPRKIFFQTIHDYKGYKMNKIKDGHTDVASAKRQCANIIEDCKDIINALPNDDEASLPTWWTNKLAVYAAYINSDRDYLVFTMQQASEEEAPAATRSNNYYRF